MSVIGIFRQLFHLREVEDPLAVRNDAANGVLPGLVPYGGKELCGAVASSPFGETCRVDSEDFPSCNVRSTKINLCIARKGG